MRQRQPIALRGQPGIEVNAPLSVAEMGFSLHAATTASADDARGREALVRYVLRPPIAQERLHILPNGVTSANLSNPRLAHPPGTLRFSRPRCCGASLQSSTEFASPRLAHQLRLAQRPDFR